jgi:hypothetical protein
MASQKLTNCGVAAIALAASTYLSTPHCSTMARLAVGAFCIATTSEAFCESFRSDGIAKKKAFCGQKA